MCLGTGRPQTCGEGSARHAVRSCSGTHSALLEELDGPPDPGAEQAWLDEIQRRSRELDAGLVETIPADQVFADARAKLAQR